MDREDAADHERLEPQDRHVLAVGIAQAVDGGGTALDAQNERRPGLVGEHGRTQGHIDARSLLTIGARPLETLDAPVLQALELVFDVGLCELQARVQLQGRCVHVRG